MRVPLDDEVDSSYGLGSTTKTLGRRPRKGFGRQIQLTSKHIEEGVYDFHVPAENQRSEQVDDVKMEGDNC